MLLTKLDKILEAIIFLSAEAISIDEIAAKLELQPSEISKAVDTLKTRYSDESGIKLIKFNGKLQFASNPDYAGFVETVLNPIKEKELSRACLETAAVVAYKQPITKLDIEEIRGVSSDYALQMLIKHNLVQMVGRKDAIGKPLLYGTTEQFLKRFKLESIDKLPDYGELLERLSVIEPPKDVPLYNHFEIPQDEEIPEFLSGEDIEIIS